MPVSALIVNDVVLVYIEKQPAFFARVEKISPDSKKGWWQITFLILHLPLRTVTWILDDDQIRGLAFTMGGAEVQIYRVEPQLSPADTAHHEAGQKGSARILSMDKNND
ncbi:hypothetical protein JXB12_00930 [candidate division KSB1 bacterium]|nr:hypothetical protein [candidate division KSB1 bacterium]